MLLSWLLLTGCTSTPLDVEVEVHPEVGTMVRITWDTETPNDSWVEFGTDGSLDQVTPVAETRREHRHMLLGLPALADVSWRAVSVDADGVERVAEGVARTNGLPSELPDLEVATYDPDRADPRPYLLGATFGICSVYAVDRAGQWLWYRQEAEDRILVEVAFGRDGQTILYNSFNADFNVDDSRVDRLSFDHSVEEVIQTPLGHHAFAELPDGSLAYLAIDVRDWRDTETGDLVRVVGDRIEILPADGGDPWILFSTWDWGEPRIHDRWDSGFYPQGFDWTHGNKLAWSDERGTLLLSLGNVDTVLEVDGATGEVVGSFGADGEVGFAAGSTPFSFPHDPHWTPEGHLLLMATVDLDGVATTMALEYEVDDAAGVLREVWSYGADQGIEAVAEGMARPLPNGNRLLGWGVKGLMREVTPEGDVVWELSSALGSGFGDAELFSDFYSGS